MTHIALGLGPLDHLPLPLSVNQQGRLRLPELARLRAQQIGNSPAKRFVGGPAVGFCALVPMGDVSV